MYWTSRIYLEKVLRLIEINKCKVYFVTIRSTPGKDAACSTKRDCSELSFFKRSWIPSASSDGFVEFNRFTIPGWKRNFNCKRAASKFVIWWTVPDPEQDGSTRIYLTSSYSEGFKWRKSSQWTVTFDARAFEMVCRKVLQRFTSRSMAIMGLQVQNIKKIYTYSEELF